MQKTSTVPLQFPIGLTARPRLLPASSKHRTHINEIAFATRIRELQVIPTGFRNWSPAFGVLTTHGASNPQYCSCWKELRLAFALMATSLMTISSFRHITLPLMLDFHWSFLKPLTFRRRPLCPRLALRLRLHLHQHLWDKPVRSTQQAYPALLLEQ